MPYAVLLLLLFVSTLGIVLWVVLLCLASQEDRINAAYFKMIDCASAIRVLQEKQERRHESFVTLLPIAQALLRPFYGLDSGKEIARLEAQLEALQSGDLRGINPFVLPGYVLQRKLERIGRGRIYQAILRKNLEMYGRQYAPYRSMHLLAGMLSYMLIGLCAGVCLGSAILATGNMTAGFGILIVLPLLIGVAVYAMYDDISDKVNKRRENIVRQYPNIVSKLALLVSSGMMMGQAWRETAYSQNGEMYIEMRRTAQELEQNIGAETAYAAFIERCSTKEAAKLASAITQNLSKGNAEIGRLLRDMAKESWQDRKNNARKSAEKANSKLIIPSMMLFIAILIMIMVPVAISFTGI